MVDWRQALIKPPDVSISVLSGTAKPFQVALVEPVEYPLLGCEFKLVFYEHIRMEAFNPKFSVHQS
jgi:hypothetical protein